MNKKEHKETEKKKNNVTTCSVDKPFTTADEDLFRL